MCHCGLFIFIVPGSLPESCRCSVCTVWLAECLNVRYKLALHPPPPAIPRTWDLQNCANFELLSKSTLVIVRRLAKYLRDDHRHPRQTILSKLFYAKILQGISALIWNILDCEFLRFKENVCLVCVIVKHFLYGCCMLEDNRSVRYEVACWLQHHWLEELTPQLTMIPISHTTWSRSQHALKEREPGTRRKQGAERFPGLIYLVP